MKKPLFFCLAIILTSTLYSQIKFQSTYGGLFDEVGHEVIINNSGGYAIGGWTESYGSGSKSFYLIDLDSCGNLNFSRTVGLYKEEQAFSISQKSNDAYALYGSSNSYNSYHNTYLVQLNSANNAISTALHAGRYYYDVGSDFYPTSDGGFIATGYTRASHSGDLDVYVIKYNSLNAIQWSKIFGGNNDDLGLSVIQTSDGGYLITGSTDSYGEGDHDVYILKLNQSGGLVWTRVIGTPGFDRGNSVIESLNGDYIITGRTNDPSSYSNDDIYAMRLNSSGNLQWSFAYGGDSVDVAKDVYENKDTTLVIVGGTESYGAGGRDAYLLKLNVYGGILWSRTYGGLSDEMGWSVKGTDDRGYIITGFTETFGAGRKDVYVIKTDENGYSGCYEDTGSAYYPVFDSTTFGADSSSGHLSATSGNINSPETIDTFLCNNCDSLDSLFFHKRGMFMKEAESFSFEHDIKLYPNPNNGDVDIYSGEAEIIGIEIYNAIGKRMDFEENRVGTTINVQIIDAPPGIYFVKLRTVESEVVKRMVIY